MKGFFQNVLPGLRITVAALYLALLVIGCSEVYRRVGGDYLGPPEAMVSSLSPGALRLIEKTMQGIDPDRFVDLHVHIVGVGSGSTDAWVNPRAFSIFHPFLTARTRVYMSAAGVSPGQDLDARYVERLTALIRSIPSHGRYHILAFDWRYKTDGARSMDESSFYTPNEYVIQLAEEYPDLFVPVISIHPFRLDALDALEHWAARGCKYLKWLPNTMGIDPSSERLDPFYRKMAELGMVLLAHTGKELAVVATSQAFGNPLLLRRPLDTGVRVVALHSASLGRFDDLDARDGRKAQGFDLLLRLLDDPRYEGLLFAEISALTFSNHLSKPLRRLLERPDLHPRFINGSDYPLPGIRFLDGTDTLVQEQFLTEEEAEFLREIYSYNPLLFDLAVKRTVRHPETGVSLPPSVFMLPASLPLR